eukprot:COSAG01_NODE_5096_length_4491_cov_1.662796_2_plen_217_part_00
MILSLNTAVLPYGFALFDQERVLFQQSLDGARLSEQLIAAIHQAASQHGGLRAIKAMTLSKGPGRYTSLRIGATTLRSMAQVFNAPITGFCSLRAMAHSYRYYQGLIFALLPSLKHHYHARLFAADGHSIVAKTPLMHLTLAQCQQHLSSYQAPIKVLGQWDETLQLSLEKLSQLQVHSADLDLRSLYDLYVQQQDQQAESAQDHWRKLTLVYQEK